MKIFKQYVYISAKEKTGIEELKSKLVQVTKAKQEKFILKRYRKSQRYCSVGNSY